MNDAHASDEAWGWYGRSRQKQDRRHLLIGSPVPFGCRHGADWSFSWVWYGGRTPARGPRLE